MIFNIYRIMYAFLAVMLFWNLYQEDSTPKKIGYAFVVLPFFLRALLIK